ncbi:hypothetical protein [Flavobacterium sp. H122]|uniref:hypothetical protein n=1 Tax=Flavobacterium sp. H122 TaxID=2529860 RepID=UPI0010AAD4D8|nr:hypothetical protein [Flavobacterium sp. H122]
MKKIDLLIGVLIGFATTFIGIIIFFEFFSEYSFEEGIQSMKQLGYLGKVITLGAILNIAVFFGLLKFDKELMARGVVLATLILTVITMLV